MSAKNILTSIGMTGYARVYLNVELEEAKRRYRITENREPNDPLTDVSIKNIEFEDEFWTYEVSEP